jgi:iron complex transport system ATP-binding protein
LSILKATNLNYSVGSSQLIKNVSFEVEEGSIFSIIGPNGAGKSTLLSLLTGDAKAEGIVEIAHQDINDWESKELALKRAVLPQSVSLNFSFKVAEVVLMGRSPYVNGLAEGPHDYEISREALKIVDLEAYWDRDYTSLSGGEKQRVQFARVLVQLCKDSFEESLAGKILFLDEAVANLDPTHQHQVFIILKRLQTQGLTVINVLHDLHLTAQYSDHVLVMKNAQMLTCDTMQKVMTPERLEEIYEIPFRVIDDPETDWPLLITG